MTFEDDNTMISNREIAARLLARIGSVLVGPILALANKSSEMAALRALQATNDAELQSNGTSRVDAVQRLFRHEG